MYGNLLTAGTDTVASVIEQSGTVVTAVLGWVGEVTSTITGSGLLFATVGFFFLGGTIGIVGRLLSRN